MTDQLEQIKTFLSDKGSLLNWRSIEIQSGMARNTIKNFVFHDQLLPVEQNLQSLIAVLSKVGLVIVEKESQ
ncbi:hypothetical protein QNI19_32265 [Cytophagaceae bacterium DM2B3-1]|uniref:Transcriptional regulator n=1 Tax=Xanthocytophaga flava TaxID=3048013 RepID=A0ABT7CV71_9BACT|nr:hypothetical protein [Xanthocytophaga flavus]MDJ1497659.1 hypothetical protein [Xanthocytophaga flavus]